MKLSHLQLAAAHDLQNWELLAEHALPLVKLVIGRLARNGAERTEDLLQEGNLAALEAIRTWRPLECTLSTHVVQGVQRALYDHRVVEGNRGVGSQKQRAAVFSLGDTRDFEGERVSDDPEDDVGDSTFEGSLTYTGVRRPNGQFDGPGVVPEGYGDPGDEADRQRAEEAVRVAAERLPEEYRDLMPTIIGIETQAAYAERKGIPLRTVEWRVQQFKRRVAVFLPNFGHTK